MAYGPKEIVAREVYQLYNVAEHVTRCAQDAQSAIDADDFARAREAIENARRSADMFDYRFREADKTLAELEGTAK